MDTEYILDSAFELGEISPLEYAVLGTPLGAYGVVHQHVENDLPMPPHFLSNTAKNRLNKASLPEKYFFALTAFAGLEHGLKFWKEHMEFSVQRKAQRDLGVVAPPLLANSQKDNSLLFSQETDIAEGTVRLLLNREYGATLRQWQEDLCLMAEALLWYQQDEGKAYEAMLRAVSDEDYVVTPAVLNAIEVAQAARAAAKKKAAMQTRSMRETARAAIKKATKLFMSLGQEKNLSLFVSGSEVTLAHPDSKFKFVVKPLQMPGWLEARTAEARSHTPYELSLYTKEDVFLAKLCVYFKDTPVLDQLLAMSMFVQSGLEAEILEKANWYAMQNWSADKESLVLDTYPQLEHRFPRKAKDGNQPALPSGVLMDLASPRESRHWEPFEGRVEQWIETWREPVRNAARQLLAAAPQIATQVREALTEIRKVDSHPVHGDVTLLLNA